MRLPRSNTGNLGSPLAPPMKNMGLSRPCGPINHFIIFQKRDLQKSMIFSITILL
jgi:hypothetical protein